MAKAYALVVSTGGSLECGFLLSVKLDEQWERLLAKGPGKRVGASLNCPVNRNTESEPDDKARGRREGKRRGTRGGGRGCGASEWVSELDHAVSVRGAAVWWTAVQGCAHSAKRLPEGRQNGAHHYAAREVPGLPLSHSVSHSLTFIPLCTTATALYPVKPQHAVIEVKSRKWNHTQTVVLCSGLSVSCFEDNLIFGNRTCHVESFTLASLTRIWTFSIRSWFVAVYSSVTQKS